MHAESGGVGTSTADGSMMISTDHTVEEKVETLGRELRAARAALSALEKELERQRLDLMTSIATERSDRNDQVVALEGRVKQLATGSLNLELTGVWWVGIGIALQTWAAPLSSLIP